MRELVIQRILMEMDYRYKGKEHELDAMSDDDLLNLYVRVVS